MYNLTTFFVEGDAVNRIKELRTKANMQQKELAALLNYGLTTISNYECGIRHIDDETICKLCEIFNCTADYLLCRSESKKPVLTDRQAALLDAYEKASPRDRKLIEEILAAYEEKKESAVS